MTLSHPIVILIAWCAVFTVFCFVYRHAKQQRQERDRKIERFFASKPTLDDASFYQNFFTGTQYPIEMVSTIRRIFQEMLDMIDLSKLQVDDDLSGDFSAVWDLDSMADVEIIIGLEKEFDIKITDSEAKSMTTFRKVVECVYQKANEKEHCQK